MLSLPARLILTSAAIAPVGLTYAYVAWSEKETTWAIWLSVASVVLMLSCWILIKYARKHLERTTFKITSIEAADRENMAILLLYLLPLFTAEFSSLNWNIWIPALIVFAVVVGTGYTYHFNPFLALIGWHFYRVGTPEGVTYVLITRKRLRDANREITIGELTEYIILDLE